MNESDIIVIGGGMVGLTTSLALADEGACVRLLERNTAAHEASWAGAGILFPVYPWRYPEAVQQMAARGRDLHRSLAERVQNETGIDTGYRRSGLLLLDEQDPARRWAAGNRETCRELPVDDALLFPDVAQTRNPRLCAGLLRLLESRRNVTLHLGDAVVDITQSGSGVTVRSGSGARYAASACVLCTGAWTSQLLPELNVRPVKGQMLLLRGSPGAWPNIVFRAGRYLVPRDDGLLLLGSTVEEVGFDKQTDEVSIAGLRASFQASHPQVAQLPEVARWAGLRPASQDAVPKVSVVPDKPGLYVNTGHFRNGLTMAPAAAELLIDILGFGKASPLHAQNYAMETSTSSR